MILGSFPFKVLFVAEPSIILFTAAHEIIIARNIIQKSIVLVRKVRNIPITNFPLYLIWSSSTKT